MSIMTIHDIAKEAKCSVASVSKALNNYNGVSKKTKDAVLSAAKKLNYAPNSIAVSLVTNRSNNIGILFFGDDFDFLHSFYGAVLSSFRNEMERQNFDLTFLNRKAEAYKSSYLKHYHSRNLNGVFTMNANMDDPKFKELYDSGIPMVCVDSRDKLSTDITSENFESMRKAVLHISTLGYKNIAYISGQDVFEARDRLSGFKKGAEEAGLAVPDENIVMGAFHDINSTYTLTKKLLTAKTPPALIFLPDDYSALGAYNAARELNRRIPEDIAFVGYDGASIAELISPSLATVRQDTKKIGLTAAQLLIRRINGEKRENGHIEEIETVFIQGKSI